MWKDKNRKNGGKGGTVRMIRGKWWKRENMWKEKNRKNGTGPGGTGLRKRLKRGKRVENGKTGREEEKRNK